MLRVLAAVLGSILLPVGVSFFIVLRHRYWLSGVATVLCALGFFYLAWRADDVLGLDKIRDTREIVLPATALDAPDRAAPGPESSATEPAVPPSDEEHHP
jgi:hypothetical protein